MFANLLGSLSAVAVLAVGGLYFHSSCPSHKCEGVQSSSCCYKEMPCCEETSASSDCCFPGAACCEAKLPCCDGGACCTTGAKCCEEVKAVKETKSCCEAGAKCCEAKK